MFAGALIKWPLGQTFIWWSEMRGRFESSLAIWIACIGIGLLFLVRGAFQNYMSPMFTSLGGFTFTQIAWPITAFGLAQTVISPVAGWYADRTSVHWALAYSLVRLPTLILLLTVVGMMLAISPN